MTMKCLKILVIAILFFSSVVAAQAEIRCVPIKKVLSGHHDQKAGIYSAKKLRDCLTDILYSVARKKNVDQGLILRVLEALLPLFKEQKSKYEITRSGEHLVDYTKIIEIISALKLDKYIKRYLDFVIFNSGSATEEISNGMAKLYQLNAPKVLNLLSAYSKKDQKEIIDTLADGAVNIYYPRINKSNYKRLIVGIYWDVVKKNYPQRVLSLQIEVAVLKNLK